MLDSTNPYTLQNLTVGPVRPGVSRSTVALLSRLPVCLGLCVLVLSHTRVCLPPTTHWVCVLTWRCLRSVQASRRALGLAEAVGQSWREVDACGLPVCCRHDTPHLCHPLSSSSLPPQGRGHRRSPGRASSAGGEHALGSAVCTGAGLPPAGLP